MHDKNKEQLRGGKAAFQIRPYSSISVSVSHDAAEVFRKKRCLPPIQVVWAVSVMASVRRCGANRISCSSDCSL